MRCVKTQFHTPRIGDVRAPPWKNSFRALESCHAFLQTSFWVSKTRKNTDPLFHRCYRLAWTCTWARTSSWGTSSSWAPPSPSSPHFTSTSRQNWSGWDPAPFISVQVTHFLRPFYLTFCPSQDNHQSIKLELVNGSFVWTRRLSFSDSQRK